MCGPPFALSCSTHSTAQCSQVGGEKMSGELLLLLFSMRRHDLYVTRRRRRRKDANKRSNNWWNDHLKRTVARWKTRSSIVWKKKRGKRASLLLANWWDVCQRRAHAPEKLSCGRTHTRTVRARTYKALPSVRLSSSPWDFNELLYCALAPIQNSDERWTLNFCKIEEERTRRGRKIG